MKELSISENKLKKIRYDMIGAHICGIDIHPQKQMKELEINLITAVPESLGDCWICLTDFQDTLPEYIKELELKPHDQYFQRMCEIDLIE